MRTASMLPKAIGASSNAIQKEEVPP